MIADIRDRTDIVEIVGERVGLKKAGHAFKGLCPFHQEKTPSFHVLPDKRFFHCFGCQRNGDVFRFLMDIEGKTFAEAVRELGRRAGVEVPEQTDPRELARRDERSRLLEVSSLSSSFFQDTLRAGASPQGREYLAQRGIGNEIAETFRLGMAPDAWDSLARWLEGQRVQLELAVLLGLVALRRQGHGYYDRFRNRLICPVISATGETVAFSGRQLVSDPNAPKYINSPGSPLYTKGNVLFGLHAARAAIRTKGRAVVVEGNFDVLALHQAGFGETVAPLGTALTDHQVSTLRLLTSCVVLCLDGDAAGRAAAQKHLGPLLDAGIETKVAELPDGQDPDSFVRSQGSPALEDLLGNAQPAVEYFIHEVWTKSSRSSADRRAAAIHAAAPMLARIADPIKRDMVLGELAAALDADAGMVRRAVAQASMANAVAAEHAHAERSGRDDRGDGNRQCGNQGHDTPIPGRDDDSPPPSTELKILAILVEHPDLVSLAEQAGVRSLLTDARLRDMYCAAQTGRNLLEAVPRNLSDTVVRELLDSSYKSLVDPARTLEEMVRTLRRERLQVEVDDLGRQIKDAERRGNRVLARELARLQLETRSRAESLRRRPEEEPR
ncbi:MAG: DNA primase [Pseudomonadota bacterium]